MRKNSFDESIEAKLLDSGFNNYDDWEYGPCCGWSADCEHYSLKLMEHDYGYWLILSAHQSGSNPEMNIGSLNRAQDIIDVRDSLSKVF